MDTSNIRLTSAQCDEKVAQIENEKTIREYEERPNTATWAKSESDDYQLQRIQKLETSLAQKVVEIAEKDQ